MVSFPACRDAHIPITREIVKYVNTIIQSNDVKFIGVIEIRKLKLTVFKVIFEEANYIQIVIDGFLPKLP